MRTSVPDRTFSFFWIGLNVSDLLKKGAPGPQTLLRSFSLPSLLPHNPSPSLFPLPKAGLCARTLLPNVLLQAHLAFATPVCDRTPARPRPRHVHRRPGGQPDDPVASPHPSLCLSHFETVELNLPVSLVLPGWEATERVSRVDAFEIDRSKGLGTSLTLLPLRWDSRWQFSTLPTSPPTSGASYGPFSQRVAPRPDQNCIAHCPET